MTQNSRSSVFSRSNDSRSTQRWSRGFTAALVLCIATAPGHGITARAQDSAGTAQGKKLGDTILAAISVALPGVNNLVAALWAGLRPSDKIDKKEAEAKITATRLELLKAAKSAIAPVAAVSKELDVFVGFLEPATVAAERIVIMRTRLEQPASSDALWAGLATEWKVAQANLKHLDDKKLDLTAVRNLAIQADLKRIQNANNTVVIEISDAVSQKNGDQLRRKLDTLSNLLTGVSALVGLEMLALKAEIGELSAWAEGKGALSNDTASEQTLRGVITRALQGSNEVLASHVTYSHYRRCR